MGFGLVIALLVVGALLLLASLLAFQARHSAHEASLTSSEKDARQIGHLLSEQVHRMLDPADVALRLLSHDPLVDAGTLAERQLRRRVWSGAGFTTAPT